ncbi:MAG: 50S ribosomal protein L25 [Candidatus Omnitrophica bacterium]|nr:50S ribosomal protein L25 [Candidatus Omnitrophota bacterium]
MEKVILKVEKREEVGKSQVNKLRKESMIPAVCYKDGKESVNLKINARDFGDILQTKAGENVLLTLKIDQVKALNGATVIIKEIQTHPLSEKIVHVDFKEISLTEKIKIKVPVAAHGEAQDVISEGGIIEHAIWELEIECLPTQIPEKIEAEVSGMKIGDTIFVKDLPIPPGIEVLNDPELVVLTAKPPAKEEVKGEVPEEGLEEPEVIEKGKKKEEEEVAEDEAAPKKEAPKKEEKKGEKKA